MTNDREALSEALCALPDSEPPAELWQAVEVRLPRQESSLHRKLRAPPARWFGWGIAATVGLLAFWLIFAGPGQRIEHSDMYFTDLISESRSLERLVASQRASNGQTRSMLLRRVSDVDAELNDTLLRDAYEVQTVRLLEQRVALLRALADLGNRRPPNNFNRAVRPAAYTGDTP